MFGRKKLQDKIDELQVEIKMVKNTQQEQRNYAIENQKLHQQNSDLVAKINKLKLQVRKQTEADLYFVSAEICSDLLNGKSEKEVKTLLEHQQSLRRSLPQQQAAPAGFFGRLI